MLKTNRKKVKIGIIATISGAVLLAAGTMTGVILMREDYVAVGADDTSSAHSSLNKKYNSSKSGDGSDDGLSENENGDKSKDGNDSKDENSKNGSSSSSDGNGSNGDSSNSDINGGNNGNDGGANNGGGADNPEVVTTYNDVVSEESIPFSVETRNEVNMPRGEVRVASVGANGTRRIVTRQTYQNGNLVAAEVIANDVMAEPVNQINLVGVSDYNLNNSYIQLYPNASVSRDGSNPAPAFMILVNGNYYMDFWYDPLTWHRYAPATALNVSGGSFSYDGLNFGYALGPLDSNYALSEAFCAEYRLACGRW